MLSPRDCLIVMLAAAAGCAGSLAFTGSATAQQQRNRDFDELIDFVLRPTQEAEQEDVWNWDDEPEEESLITGEIGPPLLGPTGEEAIGPPLAGPTGEEPVGLEPPKPEVPLDVRERLDRIELESDPFAAVGIRLGAFVIRPSIEIGVTATDNVSGLAGGPSAVGVVATPEINVRSSDDRYAFDFTVNGEAIFYDKDAFDTRTAAARLSGRYDLTRTTSLIGEGGYSRFSEDLSDPDVPGGVAERPTVHAFDATLGVEQRFGRFAIRPSGFADRSLHDEVPLTGGGVASRRELDNTQYGGRLRTAYTLGAGITPFTEVAGGRRDYDRSVDDSGFRRSSLWGELRGGLVIDRGDKLNGEVSLGYRHEELEDGRLPEIDALLANAAILWSPRRLTQVRVDLTTDVLTTSVADESGSVLYSSLVTVSRQVTPRVRLAAGGGVSYERSVGGGWHDVTFTGVAEASYSFNRVASVKARYVYEQVESTLAGGDTRAHTIGVRLRLQR